MPTTLNLAACRVDLSEGRVHRGDRSVALTPIECALLRYLAARPGLPVDRDELLTEVWGYAPGVSSRAPDAAVARLRRKVPDCLVSTRGEGIALVTPDPFLAPADRVPERHRTNLDPELDAFVGRAGELATLDRALAEPGSTAVVLGPAGIGKTRLARRYGAARLPRHPGGVWLADLGNARTVDDIRVALAAALGVERAVDPVLAAALRARPSCLVVFDDAEGATEPLATLLRTLRAEAPDVRWLVTTRRRLDVGGAWLPLAPLPRDVAAALFMERARHQPRALLGDGDDGIAADLADRLDGVPLALELAAARVRILTPRQILDGVGRTGDALASALRSSWDLLAPRERDGLAAAAVFEGPFDVDAALAVLGPEAVDTLDALVAHSLVVATRGEEGARFRLLQGVRSFARTFLLPQAQRRHLRWAARLAETARRAAHRGDPKPAMCAHMATTALELHAAAERCGPGDAAAMADLVTVLGAWETDRGLFGAALGLVERFGTVAEASADPEVIARVRWERAKLAWQRGDLYGAEQLLAEARPGIRDRGIEVAVVQLHAWLAGVQGRIDDAIALHREADALAGDLFMLKANNLLTLAGVLREADRAVEARATLARVEAVWEGRGGFLRGWLLMELAATARCEGRSAAAVGYLEAGAQHFADVRSAYGEAIVRHNLGSALADAGRPVDARRELARARELQATLGNTRYAALAAFELGALAHAAGDLGAARRAYDAVVSARAPGLELPRGVTLALRSRLCEGRERTAELVDARALLADLDEPGAALAREAVACIDADMSSVHRRAHAPDGLYADHLPVRLLLAVLDPGDGGTDTLWVAADGTGARLPDGTSVDLSARRKPAVVLAALSAWRRARPGEAAGVEELAAVAWPEADPDRALRRLRVAIGTLREHGLGELIETVPGGYRLDPRVPIA